jgi:hypothetical protein
MRVITRKEQHVTRVKYYFTDSAVTAYQSAENNIGINNNFHE